TGNWKMSKSRTPTCEVCRHRAHSTVKDPRSSKGVPDVIARLYGSARAPEYRARVLTGNARVAPEPPGSNSPADGTQNKARLPRGSGALSLRDAATSLRRFASRRRRVSRAPGRPPLPETSAHVAAPNDRVPEPQRNAPTSEQTAGRAADRSGPRLRR